MIPGRPARPPINLLNVSNFDQTGACRSARHEEE
jgi:hypothetical protein